MLCFAPIPLCIIVTTLSFLFLFLLSGGGIRVSGVIRLPTDVDVDDGEGVCTGVAKPASCPVSCFKTNEACLRCRWTTHWCGCADAMCASTRVAKLGFCEVGSNGSASLPGQALLLVHIVWLILLGFSVLCGLF
ncbi:hypothetical protein SLA2020_218130 [Shorea laevis]